MFQVLRLLKSEKEIVVSFKVFLAAVVQLFSDTSSDSMAPNKDSLQFIDENFESFLSMPQWLISVTIQAVSDISFF